MIGKRSANQSFALTLTAHYAREIIIRQRAVATQGSSSSTVAVALAAATTPHWPRALRCLQKRIRGCFADNVASLHTAASREDQDQLCRFWLSLSCGGPACWEHPLRNHPRLDVRLIDLQSTYQEPTIPRCSAKTATAAVHDRDSARIGRKRSARVDGRIGCHGFSLVVQE